MFSNEFLATSYQQISSIDQPLIMILYLFIMRLQAAPLPPNHRDIYDCDCPTNNSIHASVSGGLSNVPERSWEFIRDHESSWLTVLESSWNVRRVPVSSWDFLRLGVPQSSSDFRRVLESSWGLEGAGERYVRRKFRKGELNNGPIVIVSADRHFGRYEN